MKAFIALTLCLLVSGCSSVATTSYYPNGQVQVMHQENVFVGTLNGLFSIANRIIVNTITPPCYQHVNPYAGYEAVRPQEK